jgi:hypothetical protein
MRRKNSTEGFVVTAALIAAAGVGLYFLMRPSAPVAIPTPAPAIPTGPQVVILTPGTMQITGGQVSGYWATLPNGATWQAQNGNPISGTNPINVTGIGASSQTYTWTDPTGKTQTTNVFST